EAEAASPASDTQIEKTEAAEPEAAAAAPVEPPPARPVTVEIHYDSETSRYIATNTETGLSVLRVADLERLQHMCDRLGLAGYHQAAQPARPVARMNLLYAMCV